MSLATDNSLSPGSPAMARIRELARDDIVVATTVNGRTLRFVAGGVLFGELPRVVWADVMRVCGFGLLKRMSATRLLRSKFSAETEEIVIAGRQELTVSAKWAATMMSAVPSMPEGLEHQLQAAVEFAVSKAGQAVLSVLPTEGSA